MMLAAPAWIEAPVAHLREGPMTILLIIIILFLVFRGAGFWGRNRGYYGNGGFGVIGVVLVALVVFAIFEHGRFY
jgi:hypothetical protein